MGNLILLTDEFPLNNGETFLETEINYYKGFQKVYIIPLALYHPQNVRSIGKHELIKIKNSKLQSLLYCFFALFKRDIYKEMVYLKRKGMFSYRNIKHLFRYYSKTLIFIKKIPQKLNLNNNDVIYSYWMTNGAHIAIKLKNKYGVKTISRCHRYDLYEDCSNYIPFRKETLMNIDIISPISNHGKEYLLNQYPYLIDCQNKIIVNYLGTKFNTFKSLNMKQEINLVSCSNMITVKRIDKIIYILNNISNRKINWYHIGDGNLKKEILELSTSLPNNISCHFVGKLNNEEVLNFYKTHDIHLFINTSDSEGLPVSIMEAMSFGTPVIATDVGGVKELVDNQCGLLIPKDFDYMMVAKYICYVLDLSDEKYGQIRRVAYEHWFSKFDAETNYMNFNKLLLNMESRS